MDIQLGLGAGGGLVVAARAFETRTLLALVHTLYSYYHVHAVVVMLCEVDFVSSVILRTSDYLHCIHIPVECRHHALILIEARPV
ncbi:hypothetical protein GY45DRAFT_1284269, partial [Cubamyces sp. BRFM 1775]